MVLNYYVFITQVGHLVRQRDPPHALDVWHCGGRKLDRDLRLVPPLPLTRLLPQPVVRGAHRLRIGQEGQQRVQPDERQLVAALVRQDALLNHDPFLLDGVRVGGAVAIRQAVAFCPYRIVKQYCTIVISVGHLKITVLHRGSLLMVSLA